MIESILPPGSRLERIAEIERELVVLRREQRLFRRIGFGESLKVMQVVVLEQERQEHLHALRPDMMIDARHRRRDSEDTLLRRAAEYAMPGLGLVLVGVRSAFGGASQRRMAPRLREAVLATTARLFHYIRRVGDYAILGLCLLLVGVRSAFGGASQQRMAPRLREAVLATTARLFS